MILTGGTAQMLIAGPETRSSFPAAGWLVHNTSQTVTVFVDTSAAIVPIAGAGHYVIPPGSAIALSGAQTFWAAVPAGTVADVHTVPSATFGTSGTAAASPFTAG